LILPLRLLPGCLTRAFAPEAGAHLLVVYDLDRAEAWDARYTDELFTRRGPCRPNPIGVTLVRVVATEGSTISVIGLDAIDGSPVLDIKPYKPIFDEPPVEPGEDED
jgi:tRNA (Thr-GGU) A37 N-methylase